MVKHTQTICPIQPMNCLSVFDHFEGLAFEGLISSHRIIVKLFVIKTTKGKLVAERS